MSRFANCPQGPGGELTREACIMLQKAHAAASSFLDLFEVGRKGKGKGGASDAEQDLLRAMLVFAAAGLDAMLKELVRRALPDLLEKGVGQRAFESFIARRSEGTGPVDHRFLASVLASPDPRARLVSEWIGEQTGGSLQSVDAVIKIASSFDIQFRDIFGDKPESDAARSQLRDAFNARNAIVHEMDLEFSQTRSRRQRRIQETRELTECVFKTAAKLLAAVEQKLG